MMSILKCLGSCYKFLSITLNVYPSVLIQFISFSDSVFFPVSIANTSDCLQYG